MSDGITGVYVASATVEKPATTIHSDNGRCMVNHTREELKEYFDRCASGKSNYTLNKEWEQSAGL